MFEWVFHVAFTGVIFTTITAIILIGRRRLQTIHRDFERNSYRMNNFYELKQTYLDVLSSFDVNPLPTPSEDHYSGVFLPEPFEPYLSAPLKVMVVGRETAGWNTDNGLGGLNRLKARLQKGELDSIIDEAIRRYESHYSSREIGLQKRKNQSNFQRFFIEVADAIGQPVEAMIYANLFAWDYNKGSFMHRPKQEREALIDLSLTLLAVQIKHFQPDVIIFAGGLIDKTDPLIKRLFRTHFEPHKTIPPLVKRTFWEFESAGIRCFRIAHPRAQNDDHPKYRKALLERLRALSTK